MARITGDPFEARLAASLLLRSPNVTFAPIDYELAVLASQMASDLQLKGADSVYVAVAEAHNCELVTWDKTQLERAGARVPVHRPSDLLAAQRGTA